MASTSLDLAPDLGPLYLGSLMAAILCGVSSYQLYIYFRIDAKDPLILKSAVYISWLLDNLNVAVSAATFYHYTITHYGQPTALLSINWSLICQVTTSLVAGFIIRCIFVLRIWKITRQNYYLVGAITIFGLIQTSSGLAFVSKVREQPTFENIDHIKWLLYILSGCIADILTATGICYWMVQNRAVFQGATSLLTSLTLYAANGCTLASCCAIATAISYAARPRNLIFLAFYFCIAKLYFNSLLSTLNSRNEMEERVTLISDVPVYSSGSGARTWDAKELYHNNTRTNPPIQGRPKSYPMAINYAPNR